jgi:hypothetical protein
MHDGELSNNGVLMTDNTKNSGKQNFYPPVVAFVSKGCMRCPDYMKRDDRRRLKNGNLNPNYGFCYRQNCNGNGILMQGSSNDNYRDQGECKPCPDNMVLNDVGTRCVSCLDYEKVITNRDGKKVCEEPRCRIGFYTNKSGD